MHAGQVEMFNVYFISSSELLNLAMTRKIEV